MNYLVISLVKLSRNLCQKFVRVNSNLNTDAFLWHFAFHTIYNSNVSHRKIHMGVRSLIQSTFFQALRSSYKKLDFLQEPCKENDTFYENHFADLMVIFTKWQPLWN